MEQDPRNQRLAWVRYRRGYESRGFRIFRDAVLTTTNRIPWSGLTLQNFRGAILQAADSSRQTWSDALGEFYMHVVRTHGARMLDSWDRMLAEHNKSMGQPVRAKAHPLFDSILASLVRDMLLEFAGYKIRTMSRLLAEFVIELIVDVIRDGRSMDEATEVVFERTRQADFYKWQIDRIVRTETTFAANRAAHEAAKRAPIVLLKRWQTIVDTRTRELEDGDRFDHADMNLVDAEIEEYFEVPMREGGTERMLYPGDLEGSPGNVINCRCALTHFPKLDADGRIIPRR